MITKESVSVAIDIPAGFSIIAVLDGFVVLSLFVFLIAIFYYSLRFDVKKNERSFDFEVQCSQYNGSRSFVSFSPFTSIYYFICTRTAPG